MRFGTKEIIAARAFVKEHIANDELEMDESLPVLRAGDEQGVWVPMRQFVRFSDLSDYVEE